MRIFKGTILFSLLLATATVAGCDRNSDRSTTPTQPAQTPTQTSMGTTDEDANTTNAGNLDERRNDTGNTGADSPAGQQGADAARREGEQSPSNTGTSTDPNTSTPQPAPAPTPAPTPPPSPDSSGTTQPPR